MKALFSDGAQRRSGVNVDQGSTLGSMRREADLAVGLKLLVVGFQAGQSLLLK